MLFDKKEKNKMTKELKKKEASQEIQVFTEGTSMGVADELSSSDVQMPSIMLMQANAELVKDRSTDVKSGDFVNSITQEIWGSIDEPLEVVVVSMFKTRQWTAVQGNEWIKTEAFTPEMEGEDYEIELDGKTVKRQKIFNYVCFRPLDIREIELPNGEKHYMANPFVVKFKGASSKNAKRFNQHLRDLATFKQQPSWCMSFNLTAYEDSNEHGSFFVFDMKKRSPTMRETQLAAAALNRMIKEAQAKGGIDVIDQEEKVVDVPLKNHAPGAQEQARF